MSGSLDLAYRLETSTDRISQVWVGEGLLDLDPAGEPGKALAEWLEGRALFVVSSEEILGHQGHRLEALRRLAARSEIVRVPDGEKAKRAEHLVELWNALLAAGCKRDSRVVAFGGGSVGDLAGFAAATVLRGVEVAQVPTTVLAQVDAALGGKTGIDTEHGKNLVGAFHQPRFVLADPTVLATLSPEERKAGLVEAVKKAALLDVALFARIERDLDALVAGDGKALAPIIAGAANAKLEVVRQDEQEGGLRKVLNFGHTLAHAIEKMLDYEGLRHGEAVAYGLLFATRLAERRGVLEDATLAEDEAPNGFAPRLRRLLARFDLPPLPVDQLSVDGLLDAMTGDKKATETGLTWVLPRRLGSHHFDAEVPWSMVREEVSAFLEEIRDDPEDEKDEGLDLEAAKAYYASLEKAP